MKRLGPSGSRLQSLPTGLLWAQSLEVSDMSAAEPPARPRGNLSRPDWRTEALGPAIVLAGERGCDVRLQHCAAVPPVAPGCRWESELLE